VPSLEATFVVSNTRQPCGKWTSGVLEAHCPTPLESRLLEPFNDKKYDEFTNRFADFKRETAVASFLFNKDVEEFRLKIFADGVDMSAIVFSLATIAKPTEMTKEQKENEEIELVRKLTLLKANMLLYLDECTDVFKNYLSLSETNNL
jgi:hypothetical protein